MQFQLGRSNIGEAGNVRRGFHIHSTMLGLARQIALQPMFDPHKAQSGLKGLGVTRASFSGESCHSCRHISLSIHCGGRCFLVRFVRSFTCVLPVLLAHEWIIEATRPAAESWLAALVHSKSQGIVRQLTAHVSSFN